MLPCNFNLAIFSTTFNWEPSQFHGTFKINFFSFSWRFRRINRNLKVVCLKPVQFLFLFILSLIKMVLVVGNGNPRQYMSVSIETTQRKKNSSYKPTNKQNFDKVISISIFMQQEGWLKDGNSYIFYITLWCQIIGTKWKTIFIMRNLGPRNLLLHKNKWHNFIPKSKLMDQFWYIVFKFWIHSAFSDLAK